MHSQIGLIPLGFGISVEWRFFNYNAWCGLEIGKDGLTCDNLGV